jgi:molybdate transport system ATP-binding protein
VLGRNGSGKSTFLRLLRAELAPEPGSPGPRLYRLDGPEAQTTAVGVKERFALVSPELQSRYLYQEWSQRVEQVVRSGIGGGEYLYQAITPAQREHVASVMRLLGIEALAARNSQELSTGELRRVLIARALAGRPDVLICDEMADGLDVVTRGTLLSALDAVARAGTQLILSTHRADEIPAAITHRLVLEDGRIVEAGRIARGRGRKEFDRCFAGASPTAALPPLHQHDSQQREPASPVPAVRGSGRARRKAETLIEIRGADVYLGFTPTLQDIHLEIRRGEHWAVLGPNGSGKSTLLKLIAGDVHAAHGGRVRRFAFTSRNTRWELRARLGFVSPELQALYREPIPGADVVASGFFSSHGLRRRPSAAQRRRVAEVLALLGIERLAPRNFLEMSYGEARRILLARALVKRPPLVLLDEPFDGLDAPTRLQMASAIERAAESGATLVVVTHHDEDLPACITHVARLRGGRLESAGLR